MSADYNVSDSDQIRGRYVNVRTSGFSETTLPDLPAFFLGRNTRQHLFTFSEYHNFSPNLLNEFRFGYNRYNDDIPAGSFAFPGLDVFPNLTIEDDLNVQLGPFDGAPQSTIINTYQLIDNIAWTKGAHSMKFGWEGRKYIAPQFFTQRVRGDYNYKTLERYALDLSPDVLGERNVGAAPYSGNQINTSAFFTDEFRVRPNLTLTLGVRYEYKGVPEGDKLQALNAISRRSRADRVPRAHGADDQFRSSSRAGLFAGHDRPHVDSRRFRHELRQVFRQSRLERKAAATGKHGGRESIADVGRISSRTAVSGRMPGRRASPTRRKRGTQHRRSLWIKSCRTRFSGTLASSMSSKRTIRWRCGIWGRGAFTCPRRAGSTSSPS